LFQYASGSCLSFRSSGDIAFALSDTAYRKNPVDVNMRWAVDRAILWKKLFKSRDFWQNMWRSIVSMVERKIGAPDWTFSVKNNWLFGVGRVSEARTARW
jgi:hypothetical protein